MNEKSTMISHNKEDCDRIARGLAFMQENSLEYAKTKIAETKNWFDLTIASGLSDSINLETISPRDFKARGQGLTIQYGLHETPLGWILLAQTPRGICNLHFIDSLDEEAAKCQLQAEWPNAEIISDRTATGEIVTQIFQGDRHKTQKSLSLWVKGTTFQIQVWRALLQIPFGGLVSYQTIAHAISRPQAVRAVGNAVGRNPISYLIPCHRVLRESGALGGYRWGSDRKALILGWEAITTHEKQ